MTSLSPDVLRPDGARPVSRSDRLDAALDMLYPDASGGTAIQYIAVPNLRAPRVLAPAASRHLAAAAVRGYQPRSSAGHRKRGAAALTITSGLDGLLLRNRVTVHTGQHDLTGHLRGALGTNVHLGIHIGPSWWSRKSRFQVLNTHADSIGFGVLGAGAHSRDLVLAETTALRALSAVSLRHLRFPSVLHAGRWNGHPVLVRDQLPDGKSPRRGDSALITLAMRELAICLGTTKTPLDDSVHADRLRDRIAGLDPSDNDARTLADAATRLLDRHGAERLIFGSWHGDWTPWTMTVSKAGVQLCDFERFDTDVPIGFDALHFVLQREIADQGADPTNAILQLLAQSPDILRPFRVPPPAARLTAALYLVELAIRYLSDRRAAAGAPLGSLGRWLLPTLVRHVASPGMIPC